MLPPCWQLVNYIEIELLGGIGISYFFYLVLQTCGKLKKSSLFWRDVYLTNVGGWSHPGRGSWPADGEIPGRRPGDDQLQVRVGAKCPPEPQANPLQQQYSEVMRDTSQANNSVFCNVSCQIDKLYFLRLTNSVCSSLGTGVRALIGKLFLTIILPTLTIKHLTGPSDLLGSRHVQSISSGLGEAALPDLTDHLISHFSHTDLLSFSNQSKK